MKTYQLIYYMSFHSIPFRMLYAYVSQYRASEECAGSPITVTYIVSGVMERNGNKVCLMMIVC